jgi:hypothetical protein
MLKKIGSENYSHDELLKIWGKAMYMGDENEKKGFRQDMHKAWINFNNYGDRASIYGWEVHHKQPAALGGSDKMANLIPLHWENNIATSDGSPRCAVTSNGAKNVKK